MFRVGRDQAGIKVEWESVDTPLVRDFRDELFARGLTRVREWSGGLIVARYRNELETLELVLEAVGDARGDAITNEEVQAFRATKTAERDLIKKVRNTRRLTRVHSELQEFTSGRRLLPYQQSAVAKHLSSVNAADFSVPGSGKTTVAYAYWTLLRRETPELGLWVIGPLSCFRPWEEEFAACFGYAPQSVRIRGSANRRARLLSQTHLYDLVLSSYQAVWRDAQRFIEALNRRPWLLVLDEAHYIKSPHGVLAQAIRELAPYAARRMVLTGTPMPRSPVDLWSPFTFLWPSQEVLGNAVQFQFRCRQPPARLVSELRTELQPFFYRTCKADLKLPPPIAQYPIIPPKKIPPSQRLLIRLLEGKTLQEANYLSTRDSVFLRRWRRARMIRLLQAASNPLLLADAIPPEDLWVAGNDDAQSTIPEDELALSLAEKTDFATTLKQYARDRIIPAKIQFIAQECRRLVSAGKKVVIWTVFLGNVKYLEHILSDLRPLSITGAISLQETTDDEHEEMSRERRVHAFKESPERRVLIANMGACSESISLHRASQHALYLERSFNAAQFIQSLDRIHRQGMPPGTTANFIIPRIPCAVERVLNRRLGDRQRLLYGLLNDPMPVVGFDDEEHRGIFGIDEYQSLDELFTEVLNEIQLEQPRGE